MKKIQELLHRDYSINILELPLTTKFSALQDQDYSFDSLSRGQFILDLEDLFNIKIPLSAIQTLQDLHNLENQHGGSE
jgi:acyl carrier protein